MSGLLRIFGAIVLFGLGIFSFMAVFLFIPFDEMSEGSRIFQKVVAAGTGTASFIAAVLVLRSGWRNRPL